MWVGGVKRQTLTDDYLLGESFVFCDHKASGYKDGNLAEEQNNCQSRRTLTEAVRICCLVSIRRFETNEREWSWWEVVGGDRIIMARRRQPGGNSYLSDQ